jgi:hypothetical protein
VRAGAALGPDEVDGSKAVKDTLSSTPGSSEALEEAIRATMIRKLLAGSLTALAGGLVLLAVAGRSAYANSSLAKDGLRPKIRPARFTPV